MDAKLRLGLLLASLALLAPVGLPSTADAARPLATGITTADNGAVDQLGFDRIKATGADFTRIIIYWSQVVGNTKPVSWDPTDPADPNYDWTMIDPEIRKAVDAGLTPLVQIYSAPSWAERCVAPGEPGICNPDPVEFQKFAKAAVARYSGNFNELPRVRYWQPWNEPNLHIFFKPQRVGAARPSPDLYRALLNRFAAVVKGSDLSNKVVGGGLAPLGGENSIGPLDFTRRLLCMKGRKKPKPKPGCRKTARFDIWAVNPYTTGGPTHQAISPDDVQLGDVREMVSLVRAARRAGKVIGSPTKVPVWVTELSWDSKPPDPNGLPMALLCRWTSEAMFRTWQAGVERFFWFSLRDWSRAPGEPYRETLESGLYFRGSSIQKDRPKRVLEAFEFPFVAFRKANRITVWGRTASFSPGRVVIRFANSRGATGKKIETVNADRDGVFKASVRTRYGKNYRGFVTATYQGRRSLPFSLKPVKDFYHPPFG